MKYCLLCGTEYLDHVTFCTEDGEPLVDSETYNSLKKEPLEGPMRVLRQLEGPFHGHMVTHVLDEEGIPYALRSNVDTAYSKIFLPSRGWGVVLVLDADLERADAAVRAVMETKFETDEFEGNGGAE